MALSKGILVLGWVSFGFGMGLLVASTVVYTDTGTAFDRWMFFAIAMGGLLLVAYYFWWRHHLVPGGLRYKNMFRPQKELVWTDVVRVAFSSTVGGFVISTTAGEKAKISMWMSSLPVFANTVLDSVPRERIEEKALDFLTSLGRR